MTSMEERSKNPGRSLTEACVLRSKNIILLKAAMLLNRQTQFFLSRTPPVLPSNGYLEEIAKEGVIRIDGYQRDITNYLRQVIALNKKEITVGDKFCFSSKELKEGYVFFYKNAHSTYITGVLILGELDKIEDEKAMIEPGMIFEFNEIKQYLTRIKSAIDCGLALSYATKKIKNNEKRPN